MAKAKPRKSKAVPVSPAVLVRRYLDAMEKRDLARAKTYLGPGFRMLFPGGAEIHTLEELIAWAKPRYRHVGKKYERFDTVAAARGGTVYCFGSLFGVWNDGTAFDGIRFIDRFEVRNGKITNQKVWNDLSEVLRNRSKA